MVGSEEDEDPEVKLEDQRSQYPDCMKCQACLTFKMGLSKGGRGRPVPCGEDLELSLVNRISSQEEEGRKVRASWTPLALWHIIFMTFTK